MGQEAVVRRAAELDGNPRIIVSLQFECGGGYLLWSPHSSASLLLTEATAPCEYAGGPMRSNTVSPTTHYHIRWLASGRLDWEPHDTRTQAEEAAERLSQRDERYAVEQFEEPFVKCCKPAVRDARTEKFGA